MQRHRPPMCVGAKMQPGRQAATGSTKCLLACRPACSCGIAMDADDGAFQHGHLPTSLRCQGAQATQDAAPDAGCRPALKTPPCRAPVHQLGRRIPPSSVSRPLRGEPAKAWLLQSGDSQWKAARSWAFAAAARGRASSTSRPSPGRVSSPSLDVITSAVHQLWRQNLARKTGQSGEQGRDVGQFVGLPRR